MLCAIVFGHPLMLRAQTPHRTKLNRATPGVRRMSGISVCNQV